jgi:hypothetical protein
MKLLIMKFYTSIYILYKEYRYIMVSTSLSYLVDPSIESWLEIRPPRRRIERFFSAYPRKCRGGTLSRSRVFLVASLCSPFSPVRCYCYQNVAKTKYESGGEDKRTCAVSVLYVCQCCQLDLSRITQKQTQRKESC